jgi:transposase
MTLAAQYTVAPGWSAARYLVSDRPGPWKAAVIRAAFGVDSAASSNRSYRELARHYGIKIDPAPIYAPKKKGKVESSVKYVKANFFAAWDGHEADDTRRELQRWIDEIAIG